MPELFIQTYSYLKDHVVFSFSPHILLVFPAPFISSIPMALGPSYHKGCTWSCILRLFFLHSYSCSLLYDLQIDPFLFKECLHIKCALSTIFPSLQCLQSTKESRADVTPGVWMMAYVCFWMTICLFLAMSKSGHKLCPNMDIRCPRPAPKPPKLGLHVKVRVFLQSVNYIGNLQ